MKPLTILLALSSVVVSGYNGRYPQPAPIFARSAAKPPPFRNWEELLSGGSSDDDGRSNDGGSSDDDERFMKFVAHHRSRALSTTNGASDHLPYLLSGGPGSGPIAKNPNSGQVVRIAAAYPGLDARPVHSLSATFEHDDLHWVEAIVDARSVILAEFERVGPGCGDLWKTFNTRKGQSFSKATGWEHLALVDNFRYTSVADLFPETLGLLLDVVGTERRLGPRHVALAKQQRGGIPAHSDLINTQLTLHLPLKGGGSGDAGIVVNGEALEWVDGRPLVIDTTFVHSTYNEGTEDVVLLLVDFWHPDLSNIEIKALRCFIAANSQV